MTMSRSAVTWARASGRWTLSTTEVPSRRAPLWTCATEAAASGSSSTPAKTSGRGRPSSDSTALATTGHGDAGTSDCSWASSRANAGPMRSGRVASIWPSLTNVTPPSARASRTDRATPVSVSPAGTPPLPRRYPPRPCFVAMVTIRAYRRLRRHRAGRPRSQGIGRGREPVGTIASRMTRTASPRATAQARPRRMRSRVWTVLISAVRSLPRVWMSSSTPGIRPMSWTMPPNVHDTSRLTTMVRGHPRARRAAGVR